MSAIFLSASVPVPGRGDYFESADPFLIQLAVRELLTLALGRRRIVWGGHPAITPMVWTVCEDLGVSYADAVALYQSRFFEEVFPEENARFANVTFTNAIDNDKEKSLLAMRRAMLSRTDLSAAVFIGGMEGILAEHRLFTELHPTAKVLAVTSPGGAARDLALQLGAQSQQQIENVDFANMFWRELEINPAEGRTFLLAAGAGN
jgi:SLOG cluster3 family